MAMAFSLFAVIALTLAAQGFADLSVQEHLDQGMKALTSGEFSGALEHYHAACSMAPKEYMNFMRRATVYLALGRTRQAIKDYDAVLDLKADFAQARLKRADLLLKQGEFAAARADYTILAADPKAAGQVAVADTAAAQFANLQALAAAGDHGRAIEVATQLIETAPSSDDVRLLRGKAYAATGQHGEAIGDFLRAAKLGVGNTEPHVLLSQLYYQMGERQEASTQTRECIKLDEEHRVCRALYRKLKKLNKFLDEMQDHLQNNRHQQALASIAQARKEENSERFYVVLLANNECTALAGAGRAAEALTACTAALHIDERSTIALEQRAKAHETLGDFAKAVEDLQKAVGIDEENGQLKEQLARAQKLLKNSLKRDYYKILGLPRNAQEDTIQKAYRKLAREWHPDKFSDPAEKETAAKKFMDIASAKEVLTDPDKRRQFDNGEDPLDAQEQSQRQQQGFNPFQGFHGFGGQGQGQQFHFRYG